MALVCLAVVMQIKSLKEAICFGFIPASGSFRQHISVFQKLVNLRNDLVCC